MSSSGSIKSVQHNKKLSPTWIATTVFSSPDAARIYGKFTAQHNWTSIFLVHDAQSSPAFYAAAGAVTDQFKSASQYQFTGTTINGTATEECTAVLRHFATIGRGTIKSGHIGSKPLALSTL